MKSFSLRSQFVTLNDISMYPNTAELRGIANFQMRCLAFCFSLFTNCYLLFVIVTLVTQKIVFGNCQLSTVTLVTQKMILVNCYIFIL